SSCTRPIVGLGCVVLGLVGCGGGGGGGGSTSLVIPPTPSGIVSYSTVYVRQPRYGDNTGTIWPEVFHPARLEPGADLMLLHPDGTEEVLVAGGNGSVTDPFVSFDAQWVYYAYFPDLTPSGLNGQRNDLPFAGSDIYRIHLATRRIEQLTHGEFTPNTGAGIWNESNPLDPPGNFDRLGYGILNLAPCPLAGGKIAFTSNRNGFEPPKDYTSPTLQLFVMDEDGSNVTPIAPMTIGSALHPTPLVDGTLMFSSYESQGLRDQRLWGIWAIQPDGRAWRPVVSAFNGPQAFHFMTQLGGGDIVAVDYYNLNNNGFGALYRIPPAPPAGTPAFWPAFVNQNPPIDQTVGGGFLYPFRMPFTPYGMYSITPFTHGRDEAAPVGADGRTRVGKFTHPSAAPNGDLLVAWTPGPANNLDRPTPRPYYDSGIYVVRGGGIVTSPADLVLLKNDPRYNEAWPRAVVTYRAVHGVDEPALLPWLPNDGTVRAELPAGTPYGLVGTSSFYKRESFPGIESGPDLFDGLDAFNTYENEQSSNWFTQGAEAGKYSNSDVFAVRLVALEPNSHRSYGPDSGRQFRNHANERMRILGEIPLRKTDSGGAPLLDPEGNPDTSFLAKIPADTPFTFQTLDARGMVLNMAQTWHQVRPGEMRANCGGCHAHSQQPLRFEDTAASLPSYSVWDLAASTPLLTRDTAGNTTVRNVSTPAVNVEFLRDVRPILQRSCVSCHTTSNPNPPGRLVLDDRANVGGVPGDYARLADDADGRFGIPSLVQPYGWRQTNVSRYVRAFQSRRSLLVWKICGERLDGWTNGDHPTESVPGDATTLPGGGGHDEIDAADIDFTGTICPPPATAPPLSEDEKMTIARWIDLGCPIDVGALSGSTRGWFLDDLKPTLTMSSPRAGANANPISFIRVGAADADSGIDATSLSVTADFAVGSRAAGAELVSLGHRDGDGIWTIPLPQPLGPGFSGTVHASVRDVQGNVTRVACRFSVSP
ncbi:MAG: hypothetical protein HY292_01445, partial [Planctomycetes bacterium]|nr:hypothetical protein [Planctomycetota bacterium]